MLRSPPASPSTCGSDSQIFSNLSSGSGRTVLLSLCFKNKNQCWKQKNHDKHLFRSYLLCLCLAFIIRRMWPVYLWSLSLLWTCVRAGWDVMKHASDCYNHETNLECDYVLSVWFVSIHTPPLLASEIINLGHQLAQQVRSQPVNLCCILPFSTLLNKGY